LRDVNEDVREVALALVDTDAFEQSRRDRKRVEMLLPTASASSGSAGFDWAVREVPSSSFTLAAAPSGALGHQRYHTPPARCAQPFAGFCNKIGTSLPSGRPPQFVMERCCICLPGALARTQKHDPG
jgi:hypothetical protein